MFLKILFVLAIALEFVFVPLFLKYSWPQKCKKSLITKMICSFLFVCVGLLAMKIGSNTSEYAKLIIWGLILGMAGDLFLHLLTDKIYITGIGLFAFLAGHIFYIVAFQKAAKGFSPGIGIISWAEVAIIAAMALIIGLYVIIKKVKLKPLIAVPVGLYALTISVMLAKACSLSYYIWLYSMEYEHVLPMIFLIVGAVFFVLSDATLALILFCGFEKNRKLKWFNIGTYYIAQILLACTILVIRTRTLYGT